MRQHRDSTQNSQFTDQKDMECQTLQMIFLKPGKSKPLFTDRKIQCTVRSILDHKCGMKRSLSLSTVKSIEEATQTK